jgi:alpha-tubulin suppressor-like RCC1 family protein
MRAARTIGGGKTTTVTSEMGRRRRRVLPIAAALSIFAASTLVDVLTATHASAATTELYSWGYNVDGQLGTGNTTNSAMPVRVLLPTGVTATAAAAGADHSLAVGSDGKLYAWGINADGELGNGTTNSSLTPVVVSMPSGVTATAVSAGAAHSVALGSNGNVYDWGNNGFGQLGNGTTASSSTPVKVTLPAGVTATAVAAGQFMTEALGSDANVYAWGDGAMGELGNGTSVNETSPIKVNVSAVTAIAAGGYHSLVISLGSVFAYGYNGFGQLGNNTLANESTRVKAILPAGVTPLAITAGLYHSMATGSNGKLYAWGNNADGELGNGTLVGEKEPAVVSMPAGVTATAIAAGAEHSLAIGSDGNLYAWGYNGLDELGNGTTTDELAPVQVALAPVAKPATAVASGSSADHSFAIALPTPAPTTTTLSTSPSSVSYGQTVTIKALLNRSDGGGTIDFSSASTTITGCGSVTPTLVGGSWQALCSTSFPAGTYPLTATYTGDTFYAPSTSTVLNLTVNQAPLVITASSASATYGSGPPAITASYSGFVNGDNASSLTTAPTCSTTATSSSSVGSYATTCTGAVDPNYAITYQSGTLTVNTAPLAVTASSGSMTYGGSVPTITASYSGFVNGDSASSLTTSPTCTTTATSSSPVGSYATTCTGAVDPNYQFSYVHGAVGIGAAPLVITASSASVIYGNGPPAITPSYSGFVNGDTASSLTTTPTCSTTATSSSPVGSYATTCTGAVDPNYQLSYVHGAVVIGAAPLVITASSGSMTYGGSVPTITASYSGFVNGDSASSLTTSPTCTTTATSSSSVGSYATTCSGAVDSNYAISYVHGSVAIGAAPLMVTASSASVTYGSGPPAITASYAGFVNGDTAASLTTSPDCSTAATATTPVGTYATTCSGAVDPNYAISYQDGSVTVTPAPLTITASSGMVSYGGNPPTVTPIISGLQNGETSSVLGTGLTCTTAATASSPVGTYATTCSAAVDPNYAISYVSGTTTVIPAPLTITASSGTMTYGGAVPVVSPNVSGLQNGENVAVLGAGLTCTTAASSTSPVGTYPTSCSGASDPNYTISYVSGTIAISPAALSITASSNSMTYGDPAPVLTPIVSGLQNGENVSVLGAGLLCTTGAGPSSPVGDYASACGGAVDNNYTITYFQGIVTVNPATLMITASSPVVAYGTTPPAITAAYSGFVNGDTAASLTTPPTCATTATSSSPVGNYPSSCSGATDPNYTISYLGGTVQVATVTVVVTASSDSMTYGGTTPTITASYSGFVNGDTAASLTTAPTCTTAATSSSPVGSYPSSCSGAVDANYTLSYVDGSVHVNRAPLTIAASSDSMTYGDTTPAVLPTYSGFVNGDTAASLTTAPTCTTAATSSSPVGSYPSSCSGATSSNYNITYVNGSVRVNPEPLSIPASSDSMTYGGSVPAITASYSGFVNGDTAASLTTPPTCSTTATSSSPTGSYPSSCSGAVDANYAIAYAPGEVVIGSAVLVISASSDSMTYGDTAPTITASYSGFVNGDTAASLTTPPTCTTTATSSSPVGTYPSSCSGATSSNYNITYVNGSVRVNPEPLSIAASSGSMTYGGSVPTITPTYSGFVNGDTAASLTTAPTCSTTATSSSPVGSYPSTCSGAVDSNYAITYVAGSVTSGSAPLSIAASSGSMTYGGSVPTITPTYVGFVNGDTAASLTTAPTCSTAATSSSPVGNYPSTCSGAADSNYAITYVPGSVQVTPVTLSITASSALISYGDPVPTITPAYAGFVNGDTAASLTTAPTCSTTVTSSSPVGSYPSTCSGAVDSNYAISYIAGSVQVGPAPLTVIASSDSITYGGAAPVITAAYSGFVNGDTAASLTTLPSCTTPVTSVSAVGTYDTTCSGAADPNYTISYTDGSVQVGPASITVTASSASMLYGGTVPVVTASVAGLQNGETASVLGAGLVCSTAATSSSPVGTYSSSCSGAADPNYTITYVNGSTLVSPASLSISASSASATYGGTIPAITASYSGFVNGDGPGSLSSAPTCSTTATSSSPVGSYPSSCSGAADPNYTISYAGGSVQVMTASLVIAASSPTMTYGGTVPTINASYSGFVNGDNVASLTSPPTCSTTATSTSPAGSYADSCAGATDSNYTITYVPGSTVVGSAALVIRASSGTMTYGGTVPTITPSYSGFVNGDTTSSLSSQPTCSTTASASLPVGNYSSSCAGAADSNYHISYVSGLVTVGPAPLTISASSGTMTYGGSPPAITPSFSGFVNGQGASVLGGGLTCTTVATATSSVGSYASTCSGAADANYSISYVPGTVTVAPANLTVTAVNQTMVFGASVPPLAATISGFVNGQTLSTSGVTGHALCTTTGSSASPGGTYPVICSLGTLAATNYTFSFVPGTLTVTYSTTICDHHGPLIISGGESVLIPPGCSQTGDISVETGGSLDAEGAIVIGSLSFNSGAVLRFCSTTVHGQTYVTLASHGVVLGDGTSSCLGSNATGAVTLTGNTAGVSLQKAQNAGAVSITSNSGGVIMENCAQSGAVAVQNNTGGTTVVSNSIKGGLTVSGNAAPVVDRPNTVNGSQQLQ